MDATEEEREATVPTEETGFISLQNVPFEQEEENYYPHHSPYDEQIAIFSVKSEILENGTLSPETLEVEDENENDLIREMDMITPSIISNEPMHSGTCMNDIIIDRIQDQNVKTELLRITEQIDNNIQRCHIVSTEARVTLAEKRAVLRELKVIEEKILKYSVEEAKVKKIKKRKGKDSAETGHHRFTYFCRFGIPYFKTKDRFPSDMNKDYKEIMRVNKFMLHTLPRVRRFLRKDAQTLDFGMLKQLKTKRILQLNTHLQQLNKKEKFATGNELYEKRKRICDLIVETANVTDVQETRDWNLPVDFMSLVDETNRFSGEDYERMWALFANPKFSREDFSSEEVAKLRKLVEEIGAQDWDRIASLLNTNRTGFMCFSKYMAIEKKGKNMKWTKEEDDLLRKLCSNLDEMKKSSARYYCWRNIRRFFPHRTYSQIHAHWSYVLSPSVKKGRFTETEHKQIKLMIKEGKSFKEIAKVIKTRTCVQIRSHYEQKVAAQNINKGAWSRDEEAKLLALVKEHGVKNWVKISEEMKTRTRTQCRLKYLQFATKGPESDQFVDETPNEPRKAKTKKQKGDTSKSKRIQIKKKAKIKKRKGNTNVS